MSKAKPVWIKWFPRDALDGMQALDPWEELAYRRILDLIYTTGDNLLDDPKKLGWMTKTASRWPRIRDALLEQGKIEIIDGRVSNSRCRETLKKCEEFFAQKGVAGRASAEKRNSLRNNNTPATDVATDDTTSEPTNQISEGRKESSLRSDSLSVTKARRNAISGDFERWWQQVPRKVAKGAAEREYCLARKHTDAETLLAGIMRYGAEVRGTDPTYTKHPATWLRKQCWLDEPAPPRAPRNGGRPGEGLTGFAGALALMHQDEPL